MREKESMSQEKKPINQNLTVPNALSVLRIVIIPFFAWFFLKDQLAPAVTLLALSGLSDCVDGLLARKLNQVTELGKMLDPVADKLLTLSAFIMLIQQGLMPAWATVIILARELCVDGLRMVAVTKGQVIAAGKLGKIKTVCQIVLILWLMLLRQPVTQSLLSGALCLVVVVMTLWSDADYFVKNSGVLMEKDAK